MTVFLVKPPPEAPKCNLMFPNVVAELWQWNEEHRKLVEFPDLRNGGGGGVRQAYNGEVGPPYIKVKV